MPIFLFVLLLADAAGVALRLPITILLSLYLVKSMSRFAVEFIPCAFVDLRYFECSCSLYGYRLPLCTVLSLSRYVMECIPCAFVDLSSFRVVAVLATYCSNINY